MAKPGYDHPFSRAGRTSVAKTKWEKNKARSFRLSLIKERHRQLKKSPDEYMRFCEAMKLAVAGNQVRRDAWPTGRVFEFSPVGMCREIHAPLVPADHRAKDWVLVRSSF